MKTHELKTWSEYYEAVISGVKTFEIRRNDRNFKVGDILVLQEYDPGKLVYTGRESLHRVAYIIPGPGFGIELDCCIMSIVKVEL